MPSCVTVRPVLSRGYFWLAVIGNMSTGMVVYTVAVKPVVYNEILVIMCRRMPRKA